MAVQFITYHFNSKPPKPASIGLSDYLQRHKTIQPITTVGWTWPKISFVYPTTVYLHLYKVICNDRNKLSIHSSLLLDGSSSLLGHQRLFPYRLQLRRSWSSRRWASPQFRQSCRLTPTSNTVVWFRNIRILFVEQQHVVREPDSCYVRGSLSWCCSTPIHQVTLQNLYLEVNSEMVISSCIIFSGGRELMCKSRFWFCILVSTAVQENRSNQIDTSLLGTAAPI